MLKIRKVSIIWEWTKQIFDQLDQLLIWEWQIRENVALFICGLCPLNHRFYPPLPLTFLVVWLFVNAYRPKINESKICMNLENRVQFDHLTHLFLSSFVGVTSSPLGLNATLFCRQTSHMEVGHRWERHVPSVTLWGVWPLRKRVQYEKKTGPNICSVLK